MKVELDIVLNAFPLHHEHAYTRRHSLFRCTEGLTSDLLPLKKIISMILKKTNKKSTSSSHAAGSRVHV